MKMNIGYGGSQQQIYPTNIKKEVGYLGLYDKILEVGYEQQMVFQQGNNGPFCVTPQEHASMKLIKYDESSLKDKTKSK